MTIVSPSDLFNSSGLAARWARQNIGATSNELFLMQLAYDNADPETQANVLTAVQIAADGILVQFLESQRAGGMVNGLLPIGWTPSAGWAFDPDVQDNTYKCKVVADGPISLDGVQMIDGYLVELWDRVLAVNQPSTVDDGPWIVQGGAWVRPADFPSGAAVEGTFFVISTGQDFGGSIWVLVGDNPVIVDIDEQVWQLTGGDGGSGGGGIALAPVEVAMGSTTLGTVLEGQPVIDGYQTQVDDRVLVGGIGTGGTIDPINFGVWVVTASGPWVRPGDFATGLVFTAAEVLVKGGQYRGGSIWTCTSQTPLRVDSSDLAWLNSAHTDAYHKYMTDYLEVVDFDNPWTDPALAWGNLLESLPFYTWYRQSGGSPLNYRRGGAEWPTGEFICGWAAMASNPNQWATTGTFPDPGPLVTSLGQGMDLTRVFGCGPQVTAQTIGHGGGSPFAGPYLHVGAKWDRMTLDGTFAAGGATGYMLNSGEQIRIADLRIQNYGPCPGPLPTAVTVGGSTLQAGGWDIVCTVASSNSTAGWTGSGWVGWNDLSLGSHVYTGGPTESQMSPSQQLTTMTGQGISIMLPWWFTPQPPWGYNIYARPVAQTDASTGGTNPQCGSFTGAQTFTVTAATPIPSSLWNPSGGSGAFFVVATPAGAGSQPGFAKMTYTGISGNTFTGVQFHSGNSSVGNTATIATGNVIWGPDYQQIAANVSAGTAPSGTPFIWSVPWAPPGIGPPLVGIKPPTSEGYLSTLCYMTGGPNGPSDAAGWQEKSHLNMVLQGGGNALVIDGARTLSDVAAGKVTSFEYCTFDLDILCPPGMNGIVVTNGAWLNNCRFNWGTNFFGPNDASGFIGVNSATYLYVANNGHWGTSSGGGSLLYSGCIVQLMAGGYVANGKWWEELEANNSTGTGPPGYVQNWLQNANVAPMHMLIDAGNGSSWTNMTGDITIIPPGSIQPMAAINGSLSWQTAHTGGGGGVSFTGPVMEDTKLITLGGKTGSGPAVLAVDWQSKSAFPVWQA